MEATATLNRRQRRQAMKNSKYSHNNRKNNQKTIQVIWSEPKMKLVSRYLTDSAIKRSRAENLSAIKALELYGKNRYNVNPNAKAVKIITHKVYHINY